MNQPIICISREYGSGGREIGEALAKNLNISFYDRSIIDETAKATGLAAEFIEQEEQRFNNSMLFNLSMGGHTVTAAGISLTNRVFEAESEVIRTVAAKGPCVIVGRCADYILRENLNLFSVFVCGDMAVRAERIAKLQSITPEKATKAIRAKDKQRARHYHFYSDRQWGDRQFYDIIVNSSRLGTVNCVELLSAAVTAKA